MYQEHPLLTTPKDDAVLWRYMDFMKFVSLLERSALFFCRADKLGDEFEGSFSKVNVELRPSLYGEAGGKSHGQLYSVLKDFRRFMLINCWHESPHESEAMWRLYSTGDGGIAVKSNFRSLVNSIKCEEGVLIGQVRYVDYEDTFIPEGNMYLPYFYKRKSFEHEREIRAIIQTFPNDSSGNLDPSRDFSAGGIYCDIDVSTLVDQVLIYPYAPDWYVELVVSVAKRYGLSVAVSRSSLATEPVWD